MARPTPEWIGKNDAQRAPQRVRDRIFERVGHVCHLCKQPIQPGQKWDLDHITALINGGENKESNLLPAHRKCHKDKTALDVAEKAKVAAIRAKHNGSVAPKQKIASRPKAPPKPTRIDKSAIPPLPAHQLYRSAT